MFLLFIIFDVAILTTATEKESPAFNVGTDGDNRGLSNAREAFNQPLLYNSTYLEKEENQLRVPSKYYDENKAKKKIKKFPKRTVQKIIKKNKFKTRKMYMFSATLTPTLASKSFEDASNTGLAVPTTENNIKKKPRKNSKYIRYPMPFQKLQRKDGIHSRYRREGRDVYILNDFDEMEFLSNEKDHDKVIAHVQKHW